MKHVVTGVLIGVLLGAAAGGILGGAVGAFTTYAKSSGDEAVFAAVMGFVVSGFLGAIPGGVLGGVLGLVVGLSRRESAHRALTQQAAEGNLPLNPRLFADPSAAVSAAAASSMSPGHWIGTLGESLETRVEVQSIEQVRDVDAEKDVRWLHRLVTPQGHGLRWLSNYDRNLAAGNRIVLTGTVKDHTWADRSSVTEVWYCKARKDPNPWPASTPAELDW